MKIENVIMELDRTEQDKEIFKLTRFYLLGTYRKLEGIKHILLSDLENAERMNTTVKDLFFKWYREYRRNHRFVFLLRNLLKHLDEELKRRSK